MSTIFTTIPRSSQPAPAPVVVTTTTTTITQVSPIDMLVRIMLYWSASTQWNRKWVLIIYLCMFTQMQIPGLFVKQKIELLEIMTGYETENKFVYACYVLCIVLIF